MTTSDDRALRSAVYTSWAAEAFDADALAALLETSRANNAERGLTGLLLYRDAHFLQLLEGPREAVAERLSVIAADPRHTNVRVLLEDDIAARQFPEWTMRYEHVDADRAATIPGYRATFDDLEQADEGESPVSVRALRELVRWFQDRQAA